VIKSKGIPNENPKNDANRPIAIGIKVIQNTISPAYPSFIGSCLTSLPCMIVVIDLFIVSYPQSESTTLL